MPHEDNLWSKSFPPEGRMIPRKRLNAQTFLQKRAKKLNHFDQNIFDEKPQLTTTTASEEDRSWIQAFITGFTQLKSSDPRHPDFKAEVEKYVLEAKRTCAAAVRLMNEVEQAEEGLKTELAGKDEEIVNQKAELDKQKADIESQKVEITHQKSVIENQKVEIDNQKAENTRLINEVARLHEMIARGMIESQTIKEASELEISKREREMSKLQESVKLMEDQLKKEQERCWEECDKLRSYTKRMQHYLGRK